MEIANIHTTRESQDQLIELCERGTEHNWYSSLESTGWLDHIRGILSAAK